MSETSRESRKSQPDPSSVRGPGINTGKIPFGYRVLTPSLYLQSSKGGLYLSETSQNKRGLEGGPNRYRDNPKVTREGKGSVELRISYRTNQISDEGLLD